MIEHYPLNVPAQYLVDNCVKLLWTRAVEKFSIQPKIIDYFLNFIDPVEVREESKFLGPSAHTHTRARACAHIYVYIKIDREREKREREREKKEINNEGERQICFIERFILSVKVVFEVFLVRGKKFTTIIRSI